MLGVFKQVDMVYMGNQPTVFYLYGRLKETDRWEGQPLHAFKTQSMGRFRHAVYSLGLKRRFHDYHKIYLYQGRSRVVKCEMKKNEEGYRTLEMQLRRGRRLRNGPRAPKPSSGPPLDFSNPSSMKSTAAWMGPPSSGDTCLHVL